MSKTPALAVGSPFLFEGIACTVTEVGGKSGKLITFTPNAPADFDTRSMALAEIMWHDGFKSFGHPARFFPKSPSADAFVAAPITAEG